MNETLDVLKSHRSIRRYLDAPVADALIDEIVAAAQAAPTSINAQALSLVVVRDPQRRARIAELAGGQPWIATAPVFIAFVMDYCKTGLAGRKVGKPQQVHESVEGFLAGVLDVGIAMGNAIAAAESLGLGIVPIGGIRANPREMIALLELPAWTFPVAGLVVGHPADRSRMKPRMDVRAFRHEETYHRDGLEALIEDYDRAMAIYLAEVGRQKEVDWSTATAAFYDRVYFPDVMASAREQGFSLDK